MIDTSRHEMVRKLIERLEIHEPECSEITALSDYDVGCNCSGLEHLRQSLLACGLHVQDERQRRAEGIVDAINSHDERDRTHLKHWAQTYREKWPKEAP